MPNVPGNNRIARQVSAIPTNTLRMSETDLDRLRGELDAGSPENDSRRGYLRWPFKANAVQVEVRHPGGQITALSYACRNLSCGGMSVLHSAYVHVGTPCTVFLPRANKTTARIEGKISRCRHAKGSIHELGIQFASPITIGEFIQLDPYEGRFSLEKINPERLGGTLLHVEDSDMDRRLVRTFLKDTNLSVVTAEDGKAALTRVKEGFDVILCDINLTGMSGIDFCTQLRAQGVEKPVIVVSADVRSQTRQQIKAARANAFLAKPFSRDLLLRALGEFLLADGKGAEGVGPLYSTLAFDDPSFGFVAEFVGELHNLAGKLNQLIAANDVEEVRRHCMSVIGAAGVLGFRPVGEAAQAALTAVTAAMSVTEAAEQVRTFMFESLRARASEEPSRKAA